MYDQLIKMISTLGFPIAVSVYLLTILEKKIDILNQSIKDLRKDIALAAKDEKK